MLRTACRGSTKLHCGRTANEPGKQPQAQALGSGYEAAARTVRDPAKGSASGAFRVFLRAAVPHACQVVRLSLTMDMLKMPSVARTGLL